MYKITRTIAEIKALVRNMDAIENQFLWNDGAETWTLDAFVDELGDEALEDMCPDSEITLVADGLTEDGEEAFVDGFSDVAPRGYDIENDCQTPSPWCAPWHWANKNEWFNPRLTPYQMGKAWAKQCSSEIKALLEAE